MVMIDARCTFGDAIISNTDIVFVYREGRGMTSSDLYSSIAYR